MTDGIGTNGMWRSIRAGFTGFIRRTIRGAGLWRVRTINGVDIIEKVPLSGCGLAVGL